MGLNPGYLPKSFLLYNLPTQLSVASYTPDSAVGSRRQMDKIYGSLLRDDISRSCILLPSNSRKPIFHNFQVHLSFFLSFCFHSRERIENTKSKGSKGLSCHDLQVDERVRVQSSGNFGQFEFFSTLWHSTE